MKNQFNNRNRSRKLPKGVVTTNPNNCLKTDILQAKSVLRKRNHGNSSKSPPENESKKLIIGEVKILKRGEALTDVVKLLQNSSAIKQEKRSDLVVPTLTGSNRYAGSSLCISPPPSSLPVPGFCKKKTLDVGDSNSAADLQRSLNLDLD